MSGKPINRQRLDRLLNRYRRHDFTLWTAAAILALAFLIIFALYDSIRTTRLKDQQVQAFSLKGQLTEFLLLTREPDGTSLLENPKDFSKAQRPLRVISLRRPFFSYFLNKANARTFKADEIRWDAPRACLLEFSQIKPGGEHAPPFTIQACFAALPGDAAGHYIYFALRYPVTAIRRHEPGRPISDSDRVVLRFGTDRETRFTLVFEPHPMASKAQARKAAQTRRFEGIHEVTAFMAEEPGRASRFVNAQAYERLVETASDTPQNMVTVAGRINAAAVFSSDEVSGVWPTAVIRTMDIGIEVHPHAPVPGAPFRFEPGTLGTALSSLEQAYLSAIPSRARLEITTLGPQGPQAIWDSDGAGLAPAPKPAGFAAWWADVLLSLGHEVKPMQVKQQQVVAGFPVFAARLTAESIVLPDVATKAFFWLTLALASVIALSFLWFRALQRLRRITRTAYATIVTHRNDGSLRDYANRQDEIGTLGRVFHLLLTKNRVRNSRLVKRIHDASAQREEEVRFAKGQIEVRQSILDAIGHEIRSPLQSLLAKTADQPALRPDLERIHWAVETLYSATSLETAHMHGNVVLQKVDVAVYLSAYAANLAEEGQPVRYLGPNTGVFAICDEIVLELILNNLVKNAIRYHSDGTTVDIKVEKHAHTVSIDVFNVGKKISEEDLTRIFKLGVTDRCSRENRGLGLFLSRAHAQTIRGTIEAINRENGVSFVMTLTAEPIESPASPRDADHSSPVLA